MYNALLLLIALTEFIILNNWINKHHHLYALNFHKLSLFVMLSFLYVLINYFCHFYFYRDLVLFVIITIYILLSSSSNLADKIMRAEIFSICGIIANSIILFMWNLFTNFEDAILFSNSMVYISSLIFHLAFVCICLYCINLFKLASSNCEHYSYCFILFTNMLCIEFLLTLNQNLPSYPQYIKILLYLSTILLSITSIFFISFFSKNEELLKKNLEHETQLYILSESKKNYTNILSISEKIRKWQHDQKNHYLILSNFLQNNKSSDAINYINEIEQNIEKSISNSIETGNAVIDAVLSQKLQVINDTQIKFDYSIFIPADMTLPPVTFSSILCNIFDNAIEANIKLPIDKRELVFSIKPHGNMILIELTNSSNGQYIYNNDVLQSSKNSEHGLGLTILKELVEENNGFFVFTPKSDNFTIKIVLPAFKEEISVEN